MIHFLPSLLSSFRSFVFTSLFHSRRPSHVPSWSSGPHTLCFLLVSLARLSYYGNSQFSTFRIVFLQETYTQHQKLPPKPEFLIKLPSRRGTNGTPICLPSSPLSSSFLHTATGCTFAFVPHPHLFHRLPQPSEQFQTDSWFASEVLTNLDHKHIPRIAQNLVPGIILLQGTGCGLPCIVPAETVVDVVGGRLATGWSDVRASRKKEMGRVGGMERALNGMLRTSYI
ncbi:hypothetical protein EDC01DRAFT_248787 [Geopyxis carbonaria]|nr:hypothetical protein EDC01DRAFT_248787 [Geopyxis carbonaria]